MEKKTSASNAEYNELEEVFQTFYFLKRNLSILSWDTETYLPPGAMSVRGLQMETQTSVMNSCLSKADLIKKVDRVLLDDQLTSWQKANLREMRQFLEVKKALPGELERKIAGQTVRCRQAWKQAREQNDFKLFAEAFSPLISLIQKKGKKLGELFSMSPYEGLMQEFDRGCREIELNNLFLNIEKPIAALVQQRSINKAALKAMAPQNLKMEIPKQLEMFKRILVDLGFDFNHGRLDRSVHPFTEGGFGDIRITTFLNEEDLYSGLMGVIHECGHALYDMHLPEEWFHQPVGQDRGMAVHEGVALYFEMALARSKGFAEYLSVVFKDYDLVVSGNEIYEHLTRVNPHARRVNADELTYLLHISLRYQIETKLISGTLDINDVPKFWNQKTNELFGYTPKSLSEGCLQDSHWAVGLLGYFPSYARGFLFAMKLYQEQGEFKDLKTYRQSFEKMKDQLFKEASFHENSYYFQENQASGDIGQTVLSYLSKKYAD